jgi:hypothetical protein
MTKPRILMTSGIVLLSVMAGAGCSRTTDAAPQALVNPAVEPGYPAPATSVSAEPAYTTRPGVRTVEQRPQPAMAQQSYSSDRSSASRRVVTRERPKSHSVAIVAGGAGAGAAIGALAGGGKGAGIGALSGGAAGLIYDRLTHKKTVVVEER